MSTAADNLVLATLARWWVPSADDHWTGTEPMPAPGGPCEGQLYYVPAAPGPGTHPLYRLYQSTASDHMDSTLAGEGGYTTQAILGYAFDQPIGGTVAIRRWFNPTVGDHLTAFVGEDPAPYGYDRERVLGHGYRRHGTDPEPQLWVAGDEVRLAANLAAGGAVSELWWDRRQFVNNWDYGRQIQIACNLRPVAETDNPTEGGDEYGPPGVAPAAWAHGSPLLSAQVVGKVLTTSCHPLQWSPETFGGGPTRPVMWRGTFAKRVELDWHGRPHLIRWDTTAHFPNDESYLDLEIVTAYLTADFSAFYTYDAATSSLEQITDLDMGQCHDPSVDVRQRPDAGGVILATDDGQHALGVYRRAPNGEENAFGLCNFVMAEGGEYGPGTSKWNLLHRPPAGIAAGQYTWTAFLLVGTLADAVAEADWLFSQGI
jgi:hypothetical protein